MRDRDRTEGRRRFDGVGSTRVPAVAMTCAALLASALAAAPASASTSTPARPAAVHASGMSTSGFTVVAARSKGATAYRLYASTTRSSVYAANLSRAASSAKSTSPRVSLGGLRYTSAPYYYRFVAFNGTKKSYSDIASVNLQPATPTGLRAASGQAGTSVTWSSGSATGYAVTQATDPTMTAGRRTYTLTSTSKQFTPYGLRRGTRYYFQARALNGTTASRYSAVTSVLAGSQEQAVRVMTYNVLAADTAGKIEGDGPLATWAQRRSGVAGFISQASADVVAIEEGCAWAGSVHGRGGVRQVDDLQGMLGGAYTLARTEVPPTEAYYFRTGRYILYKTSTYRAVGAGGHWTIGSARFAAYQILENRATGARFLFVAVHLESGNGADADARRQAQTESLLQQSRAYAASAGVPVVYAGDFNSHGGSNHAFDGPGIAFRAAHVADGLQVAQTRTNEKYNSANNNYRTPPASGLSIDHVYVPAGVAVRSWRLWLNVSGGRFVGTIPSDHNPLSAELTIPY